MEKTDAETFAGYHDERAFHGGPSFEFHARAATYIRDAAAELDRLRAENERLTSFAEERDKFAKWAGMELDEAHEETLRLRAELDRLRAENERLTREAGHVDFIRAWHLELFPRWLEQYSDLKQELRDAQDQLARQTAVVEAARAVDGCDCPDHSVPLRWCTSCAAEGAVRERLERALAALDSTGQDPADAGGER